MACYWSDFVRRRSHSSPTVAYIAPMPGDFTIADSANIFRLNIKETLRTKLFCLLALATMLVNLVYELWPQFSSLDAHTFLLSIFLCILTAATLKSIYNATMHPLRSFKGPFWAISTPFFLPFIFAKKKLHIETRELHRKHGKRLLITCQHMIKKVRIGRVIRLGPNLLSFDDPALLPKVYHTSAEKTPFYSTGLVGEKAPLLQIQSHDAHKARLKALAPTVSVFLMNCIVNLSKHCSILCIISSCSRMKSSNGFAW